ncbi:VOC family protein [Flavobacterium sp.]|uniref:VOC family protein n=1 Tax=Flavobacterium sp. TaxID=239 RepID=UPI0012049098|nr:VOC family protein [Flavobacterium sp.]RZJ69861.1 MAG: glyoxalase/bleomycin resistance/extradiol dioxygenase family protein [Flavobacterium sp.]
MPTSIFVNLPVQDLNRSVEFFTKLGYTFNQTFTDENATCMIIEENSIHVMLLVKPFFKSFMLEHEDICDTSKFLESIICLTAESRQAVDEIVSKAVEAGGTAPGEKQDYGYMYNHGFRDLDGHCWEFTYMDASQFPA